MMSTINEFARRFTDKFRRNLPTEQLQTSLCLQVESLEDRLLLAASVSLEVYGSLGQSELIVRGSEASDYITIDESTTQPNYITATVRDRYSSFVRAEGSFFHSPVTANGVYSQRVDWIHVEAQAGDDAVVNLTDMPAFVEMYGGHGHDILFAGNRAQTSMLYGDASYFNQPTAQWGNGNDRLTGTNLGADVIVGGLGNDKIFGRRGGDRLYGDFEDELELGGNDIIDGGKGADLIFGSAGDDIIRGRRGHDIVFGGVGDDTIFGNAGNDIIYAFIGNDFIDGGPGNDEIYAVSSNPVDSFLDEPGVRNDIHGGDGNDRIFGSFGTDIVWGDAGHDFIVTYAGNDLVLGGLGNDFISGGAGLDSLYGDAGNDDIHGGAGMDHIFGGQGNDNLYGEEGDDLILGEEDDDTIYGQAGNDRLLGGEGIDHIFGGSGDDLLDGGFDGLIDVLDGESGADTLIEHHYWAYGLYHGVFQWHWATELDQLNAQFNDRVWTIFHTE